MKNYERSILFLLLGFVTGNTIIDKINISNNKSQIHFLYETLNDHQTLKKVNTLDTIQKIEFRMYEVIDYRLDRLDSTLSLPH